MRYVAFFDLDNTILKINSGEALLRRAHKNGILSTWKLINAYYLTIVHMLHLIDPLKVIEKISYWLAESSVTDIEKLCNEIIEKDLIPAIRPEIMHEIRMHKKQGNHVVILSSAIAPICFPLAKHMEMHAVICSELEVANNHYTGRPKDHFCFKEEKLNHLNHYLHSNNFTYEDCYYYADSINDLPVLQSVGHAVCVNPDKSLEKIARKHNWVIHKWN